MSLHRFNEYRPVSTCDGVASKRRGDCGRRGIPTRFSRERRVVHSVETRSTMKQNKPFLRQTRNVLSDYVPQMQSDAADSLLPALSTTSSTYITLVHLLLLAASVAQ